MTDITLTNSLTRKKERFTPIDPKDVRMYVCGPTVYDRAHLGNARPVLVFDILFRVLRHVYGDSAVRYVRNFTDIDDKINTRAAETGRPIRDITDETIAWFLEDMGALGALEPTSMPRATDAVADMIAMTQSLIETGHAYAAEGHVLFSVESDADYGKLSKRSVDDMIAGARVEIAPYKRNPMDFVLWKPSDADTPGWDSPWGRGRPGWHIECSAMSHAAFGETFDIHGGGNDLLFPHHENEMAQSRCAHPKGDFARYWVHNEMLQVEGKKMSKSLGNFFSVKELFDQGHAGEVVRFVMLSTQYSKPMDWTQKKAEEAAATLRKWHALVEGHAPGALDAEVLNCLADDLNTPGAIARLHALAKAGDLGALKSSAQMMGFLEDQQTWWQVSASTDDQALIDAVLAARTAAKQAKDFATADALRDGLLAAGVEVKDLPGGLAEGQAGPNFDASKLPPL